MILAVAIHSPGRMNESQIIHSIYAIYLSRQEKDMFENKKGTLHVSVLMDLMGLL